MSMSIDKVAVYQTAGWISGLNKTKHKAKQSKAKPKKNRKQNQTKHKAKQSK